MEMISAESLRRHHVPEDSLTLWWLGQAGFLVKSPAGKIVVIDPYLSNAAKEIAEPHGFNMDRLVPPPLSPQDMGGVDLYAITHSHGDHLDPETIAGWRAARGAGSFLAPAIGYLGDQRVVYSLGCVGHGVSLTHLNGQTVRDLVLERQTDLTDVFFVNRTTIPWPPEPLRGLTIKTILGYMHIEDRLYDARKK